MDEIEDLQTTNTNQVVKIAAKNAMEKIKKYYHYTSALVYNVSTGKFLYFYVNLVFLIFNFFTILFLVLDPRLKLQYYKDNEWEENYISEVRTSVFNIYNTQYAPSPSTAIEPDQNNKSDGLFHHIYKKRRSTNENELELYLGYPISSAEINILEWWKVQYMIKIKLFIILY